MPRYSLAFSAPAVTPRLRRPQSILPRATALALAFVMAPSLLYAQGAQPAINQADTAWMLVSTALVLLMTPALAFFYGGLVRSKNALNTMMMSFVSLGLVGIAWAVIVYSLAFAPGNLLRRRLVPRVSPERRTRASGHDSACALHVLPGDVRHHHRGADLRRDRGADALQRLHAVHHALGDLHLRPGGALGLGRRVAGEDGRAGFRRRHRRARQCRHRGPGRGTGARTAKRLRASGVPAAQRAIRAPRRGPALVRVVRLQRRQCAVRGHVGGAGLYDDVPCADGHTGGLGAARPDAQRQGDGRGRRHRHRRWTGRDYAGRRFHQPDEQHRRSAHSRPSRAITPWSGARERDSTTRWTSSRPMALAAPSAHC